MTISSSDSHSCNFRKLRMILLLRKSTDSSHRSLCRTLQQLLWFNSLQRLQRTSHHLRCKLRTPVSHRDLFEGTLHRELKSCHPSRPKYLPTRTLWFSSIRNFCSWTWVRDIPCIQMSYWGRQQLDSSIYPTHHSSRATDLSIPCIYLYDQIWLRLPYISSTYLRYIHRRTQTDHDTFCTLDPCCHQYPLASRSQLHKLCILYFQQSTRHI